MNDTEKERLRLCIMQELKDNFDKFDFEAHIDSSLTFNENKNILFEKIENFQGSTPDEETQMLNNLNNVKPIGSNFWDSINSNIKVLVCFGNTGSGKTCFIFKLLQSFKDKKPIYFYNHPKPELIQALGYKNMKSISEMSRITDSLVYFDEPQLSFSKYDKKLNDNFVLLCSLARQNDNTLIFSTSDTRWVNKSLESYVSHWVIKDIDMNLIKNGSVAKTIIKSVMPLAINELNLTLNEYIFYSKMDSLHNGLHNFNRPIYFDDRLSKAYKNSNIAKETAKELLKNNK
jgi:hypothetical protein